MDWTKWASTKLAVVVVTGWLILELAKLQGPLAYMWGIVIVASVYMVCDTVAKFAKK